MTYKEKLAILLKDCLAAQEEYRIVADKMQLKLKHNPTEDVTHAQDHLTVLVSTVNALLEEHTTLIKYLKANGISIHEPYALPPDFSGR